MSKEYQGYKDIVDHLELIRKQIPKGISLIVRGKKLSFQFKTKNTKRSKYPINENYTVYGLNKALEKAIKLSEKLSNYETENELFEWYDKNIKGINLEAVNDAITFKEAINKLEHWFFNRKDRRGLKRDKKSDHQSYYRTYNIYLQKLPSDKQVNYSIFYECLNNYCDDKEQRKYQDCLSAYLKLCEINELNGIYRKLEKLKTIRSKVSQERKSQSLSLDDFLKIRKNLLNHSNPQYDEQRKYWLWIFSIQLIYGLRINEVGAIKNLDKEYVPANDPLEDSNDETVFKALNNPQNKDNIIYIGNYTIWGTKVKTGSRIAMPLIPSDKPDLIELLEIKQVKPIYEGLYVTFCTLARQNLQRWSKKYLGKTISQTHAFRKLGNANGISAGIPDSIRCKSLGHSEAINAKHYQNWSGQTTIDLYKNAKRQPIDIKSALSLVKAMPTSVSKNQVYQLLASIYQVDYDDLINMI
jgi:integrase